MAQHDYDIANQSGANFRTDLNNALDAIVSNNSGSSAPSTTFAYEWWIDTSNNLLKLRNSANNAWITLPLSITADNATSGALTVNGNLSTTGTFDVNGGEIILDVDGDTSITSDTDDQIDFRIGGTDVATLTAGTLKIVNTGNTDTLILESTDADANTGPVLVLYRNSASPAQGDLAGEIRFDSEDTAGNQTTIAKIQGILGHPNHGESYAEDGRLAFTIIKDASLTEVMRITEDERVGIGTDDPAYRLDVVHDNVGEATVAQFGGDGGAGSIPDVRIVNSNQSSGSTDEGARIIFQLGSTNACFIQAFKEADGTSAGNRSGGVAFYTSNANSVTEKMRITAGGNFLLGTTSTTTSGSGYKFTPSSTEPFVTISVNTTSAVASNYHHYNQNATYNGYRFYVKNNGGVVNFSANNVNLSDERVKTNIELSDNYLEKICNIPVKLFNYKDEPEDIARSLGVIAQDVEAVAPELVNNEGFGDIPEDGVPLKTIYTTDMMYALMKAIQEQQDIIDDLKSRIETLEG